VKVAHVYIGYDPKQSLAAMVCAHSILRRASIPVRFFFVARHLLRGFYTREREPGASTDFSDTRFLVPWLHHNMQTFDGGHAGHGHPWALFVDSDFLFLCDIADVLEHAHPDLALIVRQRPDGDQRAGTKFFGAAQVNYPRKNWSSMVLFNTARYYKPPREVEGAGIPALHRFEGVLLRDIGDFPHGYNHLVGVDAPNPDAKVVHFTLGTPNVQGYADCEFADAWRDELQHMRGFTE
jgi:hypothetical protein